MFGRGKKVLVVLTAALMMLSAASLAQVTVIKKGKPASAPTTASAKADESTTAPATGPASAPAGVSVTKLAAVSLSGKIMESPPDFSLLEDDSSFMTMRDWLQRLAKARNDDSVKAVALEVRCPSVSWAQAQELSDAVRRLNDKKPVHAYISSIGSKEYLIASAAREVTMEPCGQIMLTGLGGEMMYFKGTLDLLGIRPQMIQIGKFKGAAEPMTNTKPSDEVVEMYKWLMDDLYEQLCKHIADNRNLGVAAVKKAIDEGPFDADDALKLKLVDKLATSSQWRESVSAAFGAENKPIQWTEGYGKKPKPNVDMSNPFALISLLLDGKPAQATREPTIAIIYGEGVIHSGRGGASLFADNSIGAKTIIEAFETARKDEHVKAVVFRIDSPGGSAVASEQMYQAIKKCDAAKPVIVSISHMGASGGYYIALGGRTIIADPAAIVGSGNSTMPGAFGGRNGWRGASGIP